MQLNVKVIPSAKVQQIQRGIDGALKVWLKSKPVDGQANKELIEVLSDYYKIKKYDIHIVSGLKSRNKIIEIKNKEEK